MDPIRGGLARPGSESRYRAHAGQNPSCRKKRQHGSDGAISTAPDRRRSGVAAPRRTGCQELRRRLCLLLCGRVYRARLPSPHMEQQAAPSQAAKELIGVSAYTNFTTFTRIAAAAELTPDVSLKLALAGQAVAEYERYGVLDRAATRSGLDIQDLMAPFVPVIDEFHRRTRAADWIEGILKAYVGDGLISDLHRMLAQRIESTEPQTGALITSTLPDHDEEEVFLQALRQALMASPDRAGRLALYGRMLLGEAMSRARAALRRAQALADLTGVDPGPLREPTVVLAQLAKAHQDRMGVLGLAT